MAEKFETQITTDTSEFEKGIARAKSSMISLGAASRSVAGTFNSAFGMMSRAVGVLGVALGAGAIVSGLKKIADHIDNVGKVASRLGMTTEALSELQYAARMNGSSADSMAASLQILSKNIGLAASGSGAAKLAFDAMGIKIADANGKIKKTDDLFKEIAEKFSGYEDDANKAALANALFGKSGSELINVLNLGKDGLKQSADEARKFGQVVDEQASKAAAKFNDDLTTLKTVVEKAGQAILKDILPSLTRLIERFVVALNASKGFWGFLTNFFSMSQSDFENPTKAVEKYKNNIIELEDELKKLEAQQKAIGAPVNPFTDDGTFNALGVRIGEVTQKIYEAKNAIAMLSGFSGSSLDKTSSIGTSTTGGSTKSRLKTPSPTIGADANGNAEVALAQARARALAKVEDAKAKLEASLLEERVERERFANEQMVQIGLMSREELLSKEKDFEDKLYEEQKQALERRLELFKDDIKNPEAKAKLDVQLIELEKLHNKKILQLDKQQAIERQKYTKQVFDSMKSGFESVLAQFMDGQLTIKGLFEGLLDAVLQSFINMTAQMASEWMAKQLMMMAASDTKAAKDIANAAAEGGANATASMAGAPWPINMGAPAFGAAIAVAALGFKSYMSAAGGYDIPAGTNPLTQLHEKEMVLPASIAEPLRASLANKQNGGQTVVNLHGVSAGKFFVAAKKDLVRALKGANRDFAFAS